MWSAKRAFFLQPFYGSQLLFYNPICGHNYSEIAPQHECTRVAIHNSGMPQFHSRLCHFDKWPFSSLMLLWSTRKSTLLSQISRTHYILYCLYFSVELGHCLKDCVRLYYQGVGTLKLTKTPFTNRTISEMYVKPSIDYLILIPCADCTGFVWRLVKTITCRALCTVG